MQYIGRKPKTRRRGKLLLFMTIDAILVIGIFNLIDAILKFATTYK